MGVSAPSGRGLGFSGPAVSSASLFRAAPPSSKTTAEFPSLGGGGNAAKGKTRLGKGWGVGGPLGWGVGKEGLGWGGGCEWF